MADFSITITNSLNLLGSPANLWNSFNWNAFKWGDGTADLTVSLTKVIDNSLSPDSSVIKRQERLIENTLSVTADMGSESLTDGSGYYYVYVSNVTDAENRSETSYTNASDPSTTWTSHVATTTSWS